jgi:hypothetical protein
MTVYDRPRCLEREIAGGHRPPYSGALAIFSKMSITETHHALMKVPAVDDLAARIRDRISSVCPHLLMKAPLDVYIENLDRSDPYASYWRTNPQIDAWCREIIDEGGYDALEDYHRLVLLKLIKDFDQRAQGKRYPESALLLFAEHFRGILKQIEIKSNPYYLWSNDSFCKDLAICRQRMIPCGAQLLDAISGIPRSWLIRSGTKQAVTLIRLVAGKLGSFRVLCEVHWDRRLVREFNPAGWERTFLRIAEVLKLNPQFRGVFGSSWWFDPQISQISPRLQFLRTLPEAHGAKFFLVGEDEQTTSDALLHSPERQKLHSDGSYRPKKYGVVWARQDLIGWAESRGGL